MTCAYWLRIAPRSASPAGHDKQNGTEWPPWCVLILYNRNGVPDAIAQPRG